MAKKKEPASKETIDPDFQEILKGLDEEKERQTTRINQLKEPRFFLSILVLLLALVLFYQFYMGDLSARQFSSSLSENLSSVSSSGSTERFQTPYTKKYEAKEGEFTFNWTRENFDNLMMVPSYESPGEEGVTMDELVALVGKPNKVEEENGKITFTYDATDDRDYKYWYTYVYVTFEDTSLNNQLGDYHAVQKTSHKLPNVDGKVIYHKWTKEEFNQLPVRNHAKGEEGIPMTEFLAKGFGTSDTESVGYGSHSFSYSFLDDDEHFHVEFLFSESSDNNWTLLSKSASFNNGATVIEP